MKDVDIYCFALDEIVPRIDSILSAEEQARAAQFRFARDRRRFYQLPREGANHPGALSGASSDDGCGPNQVSL